jgi:TolA-binding protein
MKRIMAVMLSIALAGSVIAAQAQQGTTTATTAKKPRKKMVPKNSGPSVSEQLNNMKQSIDAQQEQIKQLTDLIQGRDQKIQQLEQRLDRNQTLATQAQTKADTVAAEAAEQGQTVIAIKSDVTDLKTTATNSALTFQETQKSLKDALESPAAIRFKGITLTPGGFLAGESVYRNRALASEATNFNSVNYPGSGQNAISEFFGSGRQSRISLLAEGKIASAKLTGYYEADFLSAGVTSNNNQTNSYTLRQRQAWAQAAFTNGWTITGGQMWTLATENRKGTDNRAEALPMTIDPNYTVGFSFARQFGFRVSKNFNNRFWLAASLENPQTTFAVTNNANNFAFGGPGAGGSLYNTTANYSFNAAPDVIVKAAFEPGFGHYEVVGILSRFRDRVYPCVEPVNTSLCGTTPSAIGAFNDSKNGGGLGANARFTAMKHVEFGLHALYGNGVGRYSASGLPDATVNPNGTLALLRTYQGLATLEFHFPKFDLYFNGGEDYVGRHYSTDAFSGKVVGYGAPTFNDSNCYSETVPGGGGFAFGGLTCSGNTQRTIQGTMGFWIKPYNGPKGRIQFGPQYSYLIRDAWPGTGATAGTIVTPHGIENMIFTSFRYYLP